MTSMQGRCLIFQANLPRTSQLQKLIKLLSPCPSKKLRRSTEENLKELHKCPKSQAAEAKMTACPKSINTNQAETNFDK